MRKNFGAKPFTYPQPVFIIAAYDENHIPNAMNAAWGGISEMNEISICVSKGHKDNCKYPKTQSVYSKYGRSRTSRSLRLCRHCFRQ